MPETVGMGFNSGFLCISNDSGGINLRNAQGQTKIAAISSKEFYESCQSFWTSLIDELIIYLLSTLNYCEI